MIEPRASGKAENGSANSANLTPRARSARPRGAPRRPSGSKGKRRRSSAGRPSKLTPELAERLCGYLGSGALLKDPAAACGVGEATVHEWIARGEGRDPQRPPTPELERFARQVRRAMAGPMVVASNWLFQHKPDVWLARRDPRSWGPGGHARHGVDHQRRYEDELNRIRDKSD